MKIYTGIVLFFLMVSIWAVAFNPGVSVTQVIVPVAMLTILPLLIWYNSKRNFSTNKRLHEPIEYSFEKDNFLMKGESFNSQQSWNKVYKVKETKNWILIWQSRAVANPIPKRDISQSQIADLKEILIEQQVKNNL